MISGDVAALQIRMSWVQVPLLELFRGRILFNALIILVNSQMVRLPPFKMFKPVLFCLVDVLGVFLVACL